MPKRLKLPEYPAAGAFAAAWTLAGGARNELKGFFLAGLVILVFGVQDDITPMDPWVKLAAQVSVGLVLVGFGVQVRLTDVHPDDYYYYPVWYLYCRGAVSGYADNTFRPGNYTTRAQLSKMLYAALTQP